MSSKVVSYYDWSLGFKRNSADNTPTIEIKKKSNLNSIGISNDEFKTHLSKWKKKNLL